MKKIIYIFLFILLNVNVFGNLEVYYLYAEFNSPQGPYIETYISVLGRSAEFSKNANNKFQAELEITMIFKTEGKIVNVNKYNLLSPEINDTSQAKPNFIDLQRISLDNGTYDFEITIKDLNTANEPLMIIDKLEINFSDKEVQISGIEFIENISETKEINPLSKNGIDILPYVSNFFPKNSSKISFYAEIYNTDKIISSEFILKYYIETYEKSQILDQYSRFKKLSPASIIPFIGEFNIDNLASGNYLLVLEVRNRENELLQLSKTFFQRSNSAAMNSEEITEMLKNYDISATFQGVMTSRDSLFEYISCLRPIAEPDEQNFIDHKLKSLSLEEMQTYFSQFWLSRNNVNPSELWRQYKEQVDFVNKNYKTPINKGYATDRGRVYLQYGAPNDIYVSKHEPSAYPYEIWQYYRIKNENNKKFIFYNPNIAGKEYELLHSDLTGEIKTPNWERLLSKRNNTLYNHDVKESDDAWGSRAKEEYKRK